MSRFFLGNCMAHANIVMDSKAIIPGRFFSVLGDFAAESRLNYTKADRQAVVDLMNQREVGAMCPKGWTEKVWERDLPTIEEIQEANPVHELTEREIYQRGLCGIAP